MFKSGGQKNLSEEVTFSLENKEKLGRKRSRHEWWWRWGGTMEGKVYLVNLDQEEACCDPELEQHHMAGWWRAEG